MAGDEAVRAGEGAVGWLCKGECPPGSAPLAAFSVEHGAGDRGASPEALGREGLCRAGEADFWNSAAKLPHPIPPVGSSARSCSPGLRSVAGVRLSPGDPAVLAVGSGANAAGRASTVESSLTALSTWTSEAAAADVAAASCSACDGDAGAPSSTAAASCTWAKDAAMSAATSSAELSRAAAGDPAAGSGEAGRGTGESSGAALCRAARRSWKCPDAARTSACCCDVRSRRLAARCLRAASSSARAAEPRSASVVGPEK